MSNGFWNGIVVIGMGAVFLAYGFTTKPLEFNSVNPRKRPLSVWAARLIYLPLGIVCVGFGIRDLVRVLLK